MTTQQSSSVSRDKVQVLLATKQGRGHRQIGEIKKKFTVARVKTGVLRGYFLLDANWTKDEENNS